MVSTTDIEGALRRLRIDYRKHAAGDDTLYFCTGPGCAAFNLQLRADGVLQMWRFLATDLSGVREGTVCLREQDERSVAIEVTDGSVLNFCIRPKIRSGAGLAERLCREVLEFLRISARAGKTFKTLMGGIRPA